MITHDPNVQEYYAHGNSWFVNNDSKFEPVVINVDLNATQYHKDCRLPLSVLEKMEFSIRLRFSNIVYCFPVIQHVINSLIKGFVYRFETSYNDLLSL